VRKIFIEAAKIEMHQEGVRKKGNSKGSSRLSVRKREKE